MSTATASAPTELLTYTPLAARVALPGWLALGVLVTALTANRFQIPLLGWVSAVPWLVYLRSTSGWRTRLALLAALQVGTALQIAKIVTDPIPFAFVPMFSVPMALTSGLLFIGFEALRRRLGDSWGLLLFPAIATASEWASWRTSDLGSWGASAYTQIDNLALLQTTSIFGLSGIAWLTASTSALCALLLCDERPRRWLRATLVTALLVVGAHGYGAARLLQRADGAMVTVAAVVTDIGLGPEGIPPQAVIDQATDTLFARSERAADQGAELIVWNEGATVVERDAEPAFLQRGHALAARHGVDLVLAYIVPIDGIELFENKYVWLSPEGEAQSYLKHYPVPGEGSIRGTDPIEVLRRPYGNVAGAICYDYDFPTLGLEHARGGAGLVVVPSSDWAGIDPTHTLMARVRGIEGGFSVVRPVRWATSGAYDAWGRALATMPWQDEDRVMIARVPVDPVPTIYSRIGDVLPWASLALIGLGLATATRRRGLAPRDGD